MINFTPFSFIGPFSSIIGAIEVSKNVFIAPSDSQKKADSLSIIPSDREAFAKEVIKVNSEFPLSYSLLFGCHRCSYGLVCNEPLCSR